MTTYCDASVNVAALSAEPFSALARDWLDQHPRGALAHSGWTDAEVASALARKRRSGRIDSEGRVQALLIWRELSRSMAKADVAPSDFARVARLVDSGRGLLAGNALYLAVVIRSGFDFATFDRDLASAAEAEGVRIALRAPTA